LIGVISSDREKEIAREFFELFKTPWEFCSSDHLYDVIISTRNATPEWTAKLVLIYSSEPGAFDSERGLLVGSQYKSHTLVWNNVEFPVYGNTLSFDGKLRPIIRVKGSPGMAGVKIDDAEAKFVRIGYNLFEEVSFLLSSGQPKELAHIPTLEIHISILRDLILNAGVPLVEIPPVPEDYRFMVCLTHDVDFLGIHHHKLDRSLLGFIYRVFFPYSLRDFSLKISWSKIFRNVKALLSLPGVYLGLFRDFWLQIGRYLEIERNLPSTFFFIPFKGHAGEIDTKGNGPPKFRSAKYDINHYKSLMKGLMDKDKEIGLHGLDAWHDSQRGSEEIETIRKFNGGKDVGTRMHWLYFSQKSPRVLEEAGFTYDSTLGYNDAVGYRSGTTQVFRLSGACNLFELPLHVQDTAMFYKKRMGLSEAKALQMCQKLIGDMRTYGGVFTINWHQRSLGPERNWDAFYIELLRILKTENVCFVTAKQAVAWFTRRRSIHFNDIKFSENRIRLQLSSENSDSSPHQLIRVHHPPIDGSRKEDHFCCNKSFTDILWSGEPELERSF
jgi:hypothetical protein